MARIKVEDKVLLVDKNFLTLKKRNEIKKKFASDSKPTLKNDAAILEEAVERFTATPPNAKELYEVYMKLLQDPDEKKADDEDFFTELCAVCCKWDGSDEALSVAEFEELPYDIAQWISLELYGEKKVDFLLDSPVSKTA